MRDLTRIPTLVALTLLLAAPASAYDFESRFRAVHDHAVEQGFVGGYPTFHEVTEGAAVRLRAVLLDSTVAEWRDLPAAELGNPGSTVHLANAVHDWAVANGYVGGFPSYHSADYGEGRVYGAILIRPGAGEWRDVPASALGPAGDANARFREIHEYARAQASEYTLSCTRGGFLQREICIPAISEYFASGFPNLHHADYGQGTVYGSILIEPGGVEVRDIPIGQLYGTSTDFSLWQHGFEFVNYFEGEVLIDLGPFGWLDLGDTSYGLCGGMVWSALDSFDHEVTSGQPTPSPDDPLPPAPGTQLRSYLYTRLLDSFRADDFHLPRVLTDWIFRPDHDVYVGPWRVLKGVRRLSREQFNENVKPRIDNGHPVPIVLVAARPENMINPIEGYSMNHQVLAVGYEIELLGDGDWDWVLRVYDPNQPNIVRRFHLGSGIMSGGQLPDDHWRGLFASRYESETPYWAPPPPWDPLILRGLPWRPPLPPQPAPLVADLQTLAADADQDGIPDADDLCPFFASNDQRDSDGNGRGDACECGDVTGDGRVDVSDVLAANASIFDRSLAAPPLCDTDGNGRCDVGDVLAINARIFGEEIFCERHPQPAP